MSHSNSNSTLAVPPAEPHARRTPSAPHTQGHPQDIGILEHWNIGTLDPRSDPFSIIIVQYIHEKEKGLHIQERTRIRIRGKKEGKCCLDWIVIFDFRF